jgi:hypothetical protein
MLPALRTLASSKLAWHKTASTVAPGATATTHTRTVRGQLRQVVRRPKYLVSNGAKVTGDTLLGLVWQAAKRLVGTPTLWSTVVMTDTGVAELPPLYTNGRELGEKRGVTDRTIRTHMQELKRCGFISRYKYRGTNASYCVWINPNFVWEAPLQALKTEKTNPSETAFLAPQRKNLPHIELLESLESLKGDISDVEKLVIPARATVPAQNWNPLTGIAGPQPGSEVAPAGQKSGAGGAGAARRARFYQEAEAAGTGARTAEARRYVEMFWSYAKALIYKKVVFTLEAERQAKNAIWFGVFGGFAGSEPADWLAWMPGLQRRVELAADWLARNPSKFAPLPYAEIVAGRGYFDADNQQGFAGTLGWWRKEQARLGQGALERALAEAVTEMGQRKVLDAGAPRRYQASKRARRMPLTELHRYHHTKLRRLGGDEALHRFAARLHAESILHLSL